MINCVNRFHINMNRLTPTEKKVASYLIESIDIAGKMTIRDCATSCEVGQPTVVRCLRKCGFESWQDFICCVWREDGQENSFKYCEAEVRGLKDIPAFIGVQSAQIISDMCSELSTEDFAKAITLIKKARIVDIYGVELSAGIAADFAGRLLHLGIQCRNHTDLFYQKIGAEHLCSKDVAVAISQSGETRVVVEALQSAKACAATTIAITSSRTVPLAKYADFIFITPSPVLKNENRWVSSRIAQTSLIEMIHYGLIQSNSELFQNRLAKSSFKFNNDLIK